MIEKVIGAMGVQAIISTMLVGTCCFLWGTGQAVAPELMVLTSSVVMHWLGRKGVESAIAAVNPAPPPVYIPGDQ